MSTCAARGAVVLFADTYEVGYRCYVADGYFAVRVGLGYKLVVIVGSKPRGKAEVYKGLASPTALFS